MVPNGARRALPPRGVQRSIKGMRHRQQFRERVHVRKCGPTGQPLLFVKETRIDSEPFTYFSLTLSSSDLNERAAPQNEYLVSYRTCVMRRTAHNCTQS